MKYKLKLNYTEGELKELKKLGKTYDSPMYAISKLLVLETHGIGSLQAKYLAMNRKNEFDFMTDINNVVMRNVIFPEKEYVVHDSGTDCYITDLGSTELYWTDLLTIALKKQKKNGYILTRRMNQC